MRLYVFKMRSSTAFLQKRQNYLLAGKRRQNSSMFWGGGWVKIFWVMPEGQEVISTICLRPVIHLAKHAIFEKKCHKTASSRRGRSTADHSSEFLSEEQIRTNPALAFNMLSTMSKHHRHHSGTLAFNTMSSAPQRIGCFLLRLCTNQHPKRRLFQFTLWHEAALIADTLGMKGATFSRALTILKMKTGARVNGTVKVQYRTRYRNLLNMCMALTWARVPPRMFSDYARALALCRCGNRSRREGEQRVRICVLCRVARKADAPPASLPRGGGRSGAPRFSRSTCPLRYAPHFYSQAFAPDGVRQPCKSRSCCSGHPPPPASATTCASATNALPCGPCSRCARPVAADA